MNRRQFIASSVGLGFPLALAGCTGTEDTAPAPAESEERTTAPGTVERTTDEQTQTGTQAPDSSEAEVVIDDEAATLGVDSSGYSDDVYVAVDLTNVGDAPSGIVTVEVDWLDANGEYLGDWWSEIIGLRPGETWSARVRAALVDDERIEDFDVYGEYEPRLEPAAEGVELVSSRLLAGSEEVKVRGDVANNMDVNLDYVEFYGKVYNDAGEVMGSAWTNETDIPAGSSTRFDPEWDEAGDRASEAADHEVVLQTSVY